MQNVNLQKKVILAPMAGVNCNAFMLQCEENSADILYTAMLDCNLIIDGKIDFNFPKFKIPLIAQLIGSKPEEFIKSITIIEEKYSDLFDAYDINFGCCESDYLNRRAGAYLLQYPDKIKAILYAAKKTTSKPIFVKIRIGWNDNNNFENIVKACIDAKADAICVHPRLKKDRFSKKADWTYIKKAKNIAKPFGIPIIGSGDIIDQESAKKMFDMTSCDSIMIGRAAMGDPNIFYRIKQYIEHNKQTTKPDLRRKQKLFLEFYKLYKEKDDFKFNELKTHALWYFSKVSGATEIKQEIINTKTEDELIQAIDGFR